MNLLLTIRSVESLNYTYWANVIKDEGTPLNGFPSYFWFGDMDNDVDGSPYWAKDPYGQPETTLRYKGKSLNGDKIPFIVVPPQIIQAVPPIVMGCAGYVEYNKKRVSVVVGDSGPRIKIGEGSPRTLRELGLPAPENGNGGLDYQEILYRIWPGVPAHLSLDGEDYLFQLQPS